ncbi:MAG: tRNA guanosine(34) transglycosylase Tgt [Patescibacteria group bacterium]
MVLPTQHGNVPLPAFMPIATRGTVKHLHQADLTAIGNDILLSNAYHLYLRPGLDTLRAVGGLHNFMHWDKPILTDSGGFQVFSLAHLTKITAEGVRFNSHIDGAEHMFTPELSMEIQAAIGSDIQMCFDYFPGYPASRAQAEQSVALTTAWAKRCLAKKQDKLLFGIVQGSSFADLRKQSAAELVALNLDGYAVGGLAVGEPVEIMYEMLEATVPLLPVDKPRYLMGVGQPEQILESVKRGINMFDCVLPTRNARHAQAYLHLQPDLIDSKLEQVFFERVNLSASKFQLDTTPLDQYCHCTTCTSGYTRAYIRHLFSVQEPLAMRLITVHNVSFYIELMSSIRKYVSHD